MEYSHLWGNNLFARLGSYCFYNICTKSVPEGMNAFGTLTITYLVGAVLSAILFIASVKPSGVVPELSKTNWTPFVLGLAIVGLKRDMYFFTAQDGKSAAAR